MSEATFDPEPQPGDGPDYHADHAHWLSRQPGESATNFRRLLEASSLGTPGAQAARASVSDERAAAIVARSMRIE